MSPIAGGGGGSANEYSCPHGAQIKFGDLIPYLIYGLGYPGTLARRCNLSEVIKKSKLARIRRELKPA